MLPVAILHAMMETAAPKYDWPGKATALRRPIQAPTFPLSVVHGLPVYSTNPCPYQVYQDQDRGLLHLISGWMCLSTRKDLFRAGCTRIFFFLSFWPTVWYATKGLKWEFDAFRKEEVRASDEMKEESRASCHLAGFKLLLLLTPRLCSLSASALTTRRGRTDRFRAKGFQGRQ